MYVCINDDINKIPSESTTTTINHIDIFELPPPNSEYLVGLPLTPAKEKADSSELALAALAGA